MEVDEITFPLNYRDENLYDAIDELARKAKKNYLFDPKIIGLSSEGKPVIITTNATNGLRVSLTWTNVTAPMALQALLNCYDLAMIYDPKIQIARITTKDPAAPEPMITKVIQLQYSHPTNITAILKGAFPTNRSQVLPDLRTSQLVVLATDKDMEAINDLVKQLDTPTRQVLIEATLLETSQSPQSIRGIDWSGTLEGQRISAGNGLTAGSTIMQTPGTPTTVTLPSGRTVTVTPSSSSQSSLITTFGGTSGGTGGAGAGGGTGGGAGGVSGPGGLSLNTARGFSPNIAFLNADGVSAVLSLLNRDSDTEVVATPRVVLLDNETAKLEVTRAYPIFQVTPGSANTPAASQTTYTNMGTILTVSPRISGSNYLALKVTPEVSNIDGKDSQTINGQVNMANVYATRKIDTHVLIPSGNTLVMGGLISDNRTKSYTKVPILGDLPAVGLLFRQDTKKWAKQNLIIFITPTIVQDTDFQTRPASDFLKTPPREVSDKPVSALDSGKPVDWKKPWRAQR
jgi:type II secretory pathway component GspD/PulD (secretin)